jgi:hypothetical protein
MRYQKMFCSGAALSCSSLRKLFLEQGRKKRSVRSDIRKAEHKVRDNVRRTPKGIYEPKANEENTETADYYEPGFETAVRAGTVTTRRRFRCRWWSGILTDCFLLTRCLLYIRVCNGSWVVHAVRSRGRRSGRTGL